MINILYEFTYLPFSVGYFGCQCCPFVTWFQWPSIILTVLTGLLLFLYGVDVQTALLVMVPTVLFTVPIIRSQIVSRLIMTVALAFKIFRKFLAQSKQRLMRERFGWTGNYFQVNLI